MFFGLLAAVAMLTVGGGTVQSIYVVWGAEVHGFSSAAMAVQFLLLAGGAFVSQLVLVGPMVRRLGERGAAMASVASSAIGLTAMALAPNEPALWAALVVYGLGWGVFTPTITSLVSMLADPRSRGAVMGLYQASSSAARVLGPAISGPLFYGLHPHAPLALGVVLALPTAAILLATPKPAPHETLPPDARPRERV
jgi:DHA1 family tetracycline resistance protein-like MFS transporter